MPELRIFSNKTKIWGSYLTKRFSSEEARLKYLCQMGLNVYAGKYSVNISKEKSRTKNLLVVFKCIEKNGQVS